MNTQDPAPDWDVIVVGGSVAGLAAALMLGRARRRVLVIDSGSPRNRFASHMHGVLGQEGVPPAELVQRGRREIAQYGGEFIDGTVARVDDIPNGVRVTLDSAATVDREATSGSGHTVDGGNTVDRDSTIGGDSGTADAHTTHDAGITYSARALIAATGIADDLPAIPGLAERWGTSVLHCPYCHGWEVADQRLGVLAASPMSLHQAQMVRQWSDRVTLFSARMGMLGPEIEARLRSRDVTIVTSEVIEVVGDDDTLTGVRTADGREIGLDALFTTGAPRPFDGFLAGLNLTRADAPMGFGSFIAVDQTGKTSHDRIWAAGNLTNPMANVPMSIGAGTMAGSAVNGALVEEDFAIAERAGAGRP